MIDLNVYLVVALILFLASHILRAIRLFLIFGNVGLRQMLVAQVIGNSAILLLPFRLGEIGRILAIQVGVRDILRTILFVLAERFIDLLLVGGIFVLATMGTNNLPLFSEAIMAFAGLAVVVLIVTGVLPENIRIIKNIIILRYSSPFTIRLLQFLSSYQRQIQAVRTGIEGKLLSLSLLTASIWSFEYSALVLALRMDIDTHSIMLAASSFLPIWSNDSSYKWASPEEIFLMSQYLTARLFFSLGLAAVAILYVFLTHERKQR